jgi:hypothetical protein
MLFSLICTVNMFSLQYVQDEFTEHKSTAVEIHVRE